MAARAAIALLAAALLAAPSAASRTTRGSQHRLSSDLEDASEPPKADVEHGLEVARGHVAAKEESSAAALKEATDQVTKTQEAMMAALTSHDVVASKTAYEQFEAAIKAKQAAEAAVAGARELHTMVQTHNALTERFFAAVKQFLESRASSDQSRSMADAAHLSQLQQAASDRLDKHNREEVLGVADLLKVYSQIEISTALIKGKDTTLGGVGVHTEVAKGTTAVKSWSDGELQPICKKYLEMEDPKIQKVRDSLSGGLPTCEELLTALAKEYPGVMPGSS